MDGLSNRKTIFIGRCMYLEPVGNSNITNKLPIRLNIPSNIKQCYSVRTDKKYILFNGTDWMSAKENFM